MPSSESVAIFWDYENCAVPTNVSGSVVANSVRRIAHNYGSVKSFKAYMELPEQSSPKNYNLRSELQLCGVSLIDCPHNGGKDVADKMMTVDMMAYAIDNPAPATIILISGDRDFVYAVSVLCLRQYRLVVLAPHAAHASLKSQASVVHAWPADVVPESPSTGGAKLRGATISDYFHLRSTPSPAVEARIQPSPPPSPTVLKWPRQASVRETTPKGMLLRWDESPPLGKNNVNLPPVASTPSTDATAVDAEEDQGASYLSLPVASSKPHFHNTLQQPSPQASPRRDDPDLSSDGEDVFRLLDEQPDAMTKRLQLKLGALATGWSPTPSVSSASRTKPDAVPPQFKPLVKVLRRQIHEGNMKLAYSELGSLLRQESPAIYEQAGVTKLKEYSCLAEEAGIVVTTENVYGPGGVDGQRWVSLHPSLVKGAAPARQKTEWTYMTHQGTSK